MGVMCQENSCYPPQPCAHYSVLLEYKKAYIPTSMQAFTCHTHTRRNHAHMRVHMRVRTLHARTYAHTQAACMHICAHTRCMHAQTLHARTYALSHAHIRAHIK